MEWTAHFSKPIISPSSAEHMSNGKLVAAVSALIAIAVAALIAGAGGCRGNSARRIEREHGLVLPASATQFVCRGDAWKHIFMDSGAASAFEMASNDLPKFLSQLKIKETHKGTFRPDYSDYIYSSNPQYQISRSWMEGTPLETYQCASPTGDWLTVQVWPIDASHVGVCLYTDWN